MASEIRVDKITSLSGVGTISPSPTGVEIAGITTVATLKATTGIVTTLTTNTLTANSTTKVGSGVTLSPDGDIFATGVTTTGSLVSSGAISGTTGTFTGDVDIADKIFHTGDTNTAIRFPEDDHISFEVGATGEAIRIDNGGKLLIGLDDRRLFGVGITSKLQLEGLNAATQSSLSIVNNQDTTGSPNIRLGKTRGTSIGSNTSVANGDQLGQIIFYAADGTDIYNATALIGAKVNGTVGTDTIPTDLVFQTSATTGSGRAERLRILSSGGLTFNGDTANANALDDYEEGDYLPSFTLTSGSITLANTHKTLCYTKIGRQVTIIGQLKIDSVSSPSGILRAALPFNRGNQTEQAERTMGNIMVTGAAVNNANEFTTYPDGGSDHFLEIISISGTTISRNGGQNMQAGAYIYVNYTYFSAS